MKIIRLYIIGLSLITLTLINNISLFGQKYVKDSVVLIIEPNESKNEKTFQIYNINDKREHPGHIFHISEKNKYGVIPVDYLYVFEDSLSNILNEMYSDPEPDLNRNLYEIDLIYMSPELRKGGFIPQYQLNTCINLKKKTDLNSWENVGSFVYETIIPYKRASKKDTTAYKLLLYRWHTEMIRNLNTFMLTPESAREFIVPNYKLPGYIYKKNLVSSVSFLAGLNWFGFEAEMYFSSPEAGKPFIRNTGCVRYVSGNNYETFFFGKGNENFQWRMSKSSLFQLQSKFLVGINKWKDVDEKEHGLEEIMQLTYSLSELYQFNKLDQRGLFFSLGLIQDIFYFYDEVGFRLGVKGNIGLKF